MSTRTVSIVALGSFIVGTLFGALMALIVTPMSGQELRSRIHDESRADWDRATDQVSQVRAEMRQHMDSMRSRLDAYDQRVRDQLSSRLDTLQARLEKSSASHEDDLS